MAHPLESPVVGALITIKDKFNTQHFSYLMVTSSDSSPKVVIVEVTVILA